MSKIGIIGGSFDPIHIAHLVIAERFCHELNLDKVIFIPTNISPFKTETQTDSKQSNQHRVNMLRLAIEDNPKFDLDLFEIESGDISYSYLTVDHLIEKYPEAKLYMLIGADNAKAFKKWKMWNKIITKVTLTIAARPGYEEIKEIIQELSVSLKIPHILNTPNLEIASSSIRSNIKLGLPYRYYLSEKVYKYIIDNNLYTD
jgi:nicotinate-nucleotide adenylyltransferase